MFIFIAKISKYVIYTFQLVMVVFSVLMIVFGTLPIVHGGYDSSYSIIAIVLGVAVFIIAFLGCCGAIRENKAFLTAHAVILLILFILQIALAIAVAVAIGNGYFDDMDSTLDDLFENNTSLLESIELWLECCGVRNSTDYTDNSQPLPGACCGESDDFDASGERSCQIGFVYHIGCGDKLRDYFEENFRWISGIAIVFAVFEVLAATFTFWTRNHLKKN